MEFYLVGGAVRDECLGRDVVDRDWVVVGGDARAMQAAGFKVRDERFGVYLHPDTGEEYALARREVRDGTGHRGFDIELSPDITLAEDLARRDLTVNAVARAMNGKFEDPFSGLDDLRLRRLRHVTDAFADDPLRFWRAAGFRARLDSHGFRFTDETLAVLRSMARSGALGSLSGERVWHETTKVVREGAVPPFIDVLGDCHLLGPWNPDETGRGDASRDDAGQSAARLSDNCRDGEVQLLGLAAAHAVAQGQRSARLLELLGAPPRWRTLGDLAAGLAMDAHTPPLSADALLGLLERNDALRRNERFEQAARAVAALAEPVFATFVDRVMVSLAAARSTDLSELRHLTGSGKERAAEGRRLRIAAIEAALT